jgi:hypothetical protein
VGRLKVNSNQGVALLALVMTISCDVISITMDYGLSILLQGLSVREEATCYVLLQFQRHREKPTKDLLQNLKKQETRDADVLPDLQRFGRNSNALWFFNY